MQHSQKLQKACSTPSVSSIPTSGKCVNNLNPAQTAYGTLRSFVRIRVEQTDGGTNRHEAGEALKFVAPCLPTPAHTAPSGEGWLHEIKHDGFRLMGRRDSAGIRLLTRNDHDFSERYPSKNADRSAATATPIWIGSLLKNIRLAFSLCATDGEDKAYFRP
jgi:ATP-dependent DNA ligase